MSKRQIVGSMSEWSGTLRDLFRQINDGSITLKQVKDLVDHKMLPTFIMEDWQALYQDCFGEQHDFSQLKVPTQLSGFEWLVVVAKGMTPQRVYDACVKLFPCWKYMDGSLDQVVSWEARSAVQGPYAIWLRARVEAGKELKHLSAEALKSRNIPSNGLTERLLLELMYFHKTDKHLDVKNVTLCSGSRYSDGTVPNVHWSDKLRIYYSNPGDTLNVNVRSRQTVS